MLPYLFAFAISTLFVAAATSKAVTSRVPRILFCGLAVLVVGGLAGIRDLESGGTDVLVYGNDVFYLVARATSLSEAIAAAASRQVEGEFGYVWLNYAVSRFTDDPHWFYFVLASVSSGLVLAAIMLIRRYGPASIMWLTYLFTSYVDGYNLLRQGVALSLALLGIALVLRTRYRWGLVVGLAGMLFHLSAFVFVPMWLAAAYLRSRKRSSGRAVAFVVIATVVAVIGSSYILDLLGASLADSKYASYLQPGARAGSALGLETLYRLVPIAAGVVLLARARARQKADATVLLPASSFADPRSGGSGQAALSTIDPSPDPPPLRTQAGESTTSRKILIVLLVLLVIELIMLPIREISYPLYRVPMYFGFMRVLAYGMIIAHVRVHKAPAWLSALAFTLAYFVFMVILRNGAEYQSVILDRWLMS